MVSLINYIKSMHNTKGIAFSWILFTMKNLLQRGGQPT